MAKNTPKTVSGIIKGLSYFAPFVAGIVGLIPVVTGEVRGSTHSIFAGLALGSVAIASLHHMFKKGRAETEYECITPKYHEEDEIKKHVDREVPDVAYVYTKILAKRDSKLSTSLVIDMILDEVETIEKTGSFSKNNGG